jgi:hypothetical protein
MSKLVRREDAPEQTTWEQIVFAEVLVPGVVNNWGDIYTAQAIRDFAYAYASRGYGIDTEHNNDNILGGGAYIAESFIAREGDPDFIPGSWVVGMKILDADVWAKVLTGEINGFSIEATVMMQPVKAELQESSTVVGSTEPDPTDGHTHTYLLFLDAYGNPLEGSTGDTNGHSHRITTHTITEVSEGHNHRFQVHPVGQPALLVGIE